MKYTYVGLAWHKIFKASSKPSSLVVMCMLVIVAPPIVMGVWSMAFLLEQHVEYYLFKPTSLHAHATYILLCFVLLFVRSK